MSQDRRLAIGVYFGEAFGSSNYRLGIGSVDLGIDFRGGGIYSGLRRYQDDFYAGGGLSLTSFGSGFYGIVGYEWLWGPVFFSAEFWGLGTTQGRVFAITNFGVGLKW